MSSTFDLKTYLTEHRQLVDQALENYLPKATQWPERLHESMRYSLMAGGKRLRPILVIAAAEALGRKAEQVMPVACAMELIHTYSLIHDDLPAMDDDDLRRGQPTNHKVYGEAVAILAGDALLTEAFHLITQAKEQTSAEITLEVLRRIAKASGSQGMVGGQVQDLMSEHQKISAADLEHLHRHKTGKLIQVSIEAGALLAGANEAQLQSLSEYGSCIGLSFQIADDVLDIEGGEEIGKDVGSDLEKEKATYPSILGLEKAKQMAQKITQKALDALVELGATAEPLRAIANYVVSRKN